MYYDILVKIINEKYEELKLHDKNIDDIFWKIKEFEGNAIGQIGEKFVKEVFLKNNIPIEENNKQTIHDEFDIKSNGKKIEIKTARKGLKNNTFQFNGINPKYNYDFIICIGILKQTIVYRIIKKDDVKYVHDKRVTSVNFYCENKIKSKQLVAMNPGNTVNYKLTFNLKELYPIDNFSNSIKELLKQ